MLASEIKVQILKLWSVMNFPFPVYNHIHAGMAVKEGEENKHGFPLPDLAFSKVLKYQFLILCIAGTG